MKSNCCTLLILLIIDFGAQSQEILLWPNGAPGAKTNGGEEKVRVYEPTGDHVVWNIHNPSIEPFLPEKNATGLAVIIAPGGGHRELWIDHEGYNVARWLQAKGITAFVLKYRLANEDSSTYTVDDHAVADMQQAIRYVRSHAKDWNINPDKIGVMGFSAGGEVAALTDMRKNFENAGNTSNASNFHALIYPGRSVRIVPNEKSSPVFIACGYHDREDISKGMATLYLKYKELNISAEMHIYSNAGHGFGMRKDDTGASSKWMERMYDWMLELE